MRNTILAAVALAAGCGASARDIAIAKTAHYKGDKLALFQHAREVTAHKHQIEAADETTLTLVTRARWYTPEGLVSHWQPGEQAGGGMGLTGRDLLVDRSLNIKLVVKVLPDGDNWIVYVEPRYLQFRQGRPNLDPLRADDPAIPGWASGKVDQLAYAIYKRLQPYEVKVVTGGTPPSPEPPESPPPPDRPRETAPVVDPVDPPPADPAPTP